MGRTKAKRRSHFARKRVSNFTVAGPVTITKADGTTEIREPLAPHELQRLLHIRDVSPGMRAKVTTRDGRCRYCGTETGPFDVDHVVPIALGGSNRIRNLVLACSECNSRKGAKVWPVRFGSLPRKHRAV